VRRSTSADEDAGISVEGAYEVSCVEVVMVVVSRVELSLMDVRERVVRDVDGRDILSYFERGLHARHLFLRYCVGRKRGFECFKRRERVWKKRSARMRITREATRRP
jgi:hypothetical protein